MKALLIPVEGPVEDIDLKGGLAELQGLVGGLIQAVPVPDSNVDADRATTYSNEEGKYRGDTRINLRATVFMEPGRHLMMGDYIAGPLLVCGFDPEAGENTDVPESVVERIRMIEAMAG